VYGDFEIQERNNILNKVIGKRKNEDWLLHINDYIAWQKVHAGVESGICMRLRQRGVWLSGKKFKSESACCFNTVYSLRSLLV
jgi:hypothetical protein